MAADTEGGDVPTVGMSIKDALKEVLRNALIHDGLARGLRETVKALDKRQALLCVLAKDCNEAGLTRLVEALCNEHGIKLLKVNGLVVKTFDCGSQSPRFEPHLLLHSTVESFLYPSSPW